MGWSRTLARRAGLLMAGSGLAVVASAGVAGAATAVTSGGPVVVLQEGVDGCETLPAMAKTIVSGSLEPGGSVVFSVEVPVAPEDLGETFTVTDCVFADGEAIQKYTISFVPDSTAYELTYALAIPAAEPSEEPSEEPSSEEPSEGPSEEPDASGPVVEPSDPEPTISPTVLGVRVTRPPALPDTGAKTGALVGLGLLLTVAGSGLVYGAGRTPRRH